MRAATASSSATTCTAASAGTWRPCRRCSTFRTERELEDTRVPVVVVRGGRDPIARDDWVAQLGERSRGAGEVRVPASRTSSCTARPGAPPRSSPGWSRFRDEANAAAPGRRHRPRLPLRGPSPAARHVRPRHAGGAGRGRGRPRARRAAARHLRDLALPAAAGRAHPRGRASGARRHGAGAQPDVGPGGRRTGHPAPRRSTT